MDTTTKTRIAGLLVYWSTPDCDYLRLQAGLTNTGLQTCMPQPRTLLVALREALLEQFPDKNWELQSLAERKGYEIVRVVRNREANEYTVALTATIGAGPAPQKAGLIEAVEITLHSMAHAGGPATLPGTVVSDIKTATLRHLRMIGKHKVSRTLALIVERLWGTPLRPRGSVYWLAPSRMAEWQKAVEAVRGATVGDQVLKTHALEIIHDADAIEAVAEALTDEVGKKADALAEGLSDPQISRELIQRRLDAAVQLRRQTKWYQDVLGTTLTEVTKRIEQVETLAAEAAMLRAVGGAA